MSKICSVHIRVVDKISKSGFFLQKQVQWINEKNINFH